MTFPLLVPVARGGVPVLDRLLEGVPGQVGVATYGASFPHHLRSLLGMRKGRALHHEHGEGGAHFLDLGRLLRGPLTGSPEDVRSIRNGGDLDPPRERRLELCVERIRIRSGADDVQTNGVQGAHILTR